MGRPVGISIIAIVCFLSAIVSGVGGVWVFTKQLAFFRIEQFQDLGAIMMHSVLTSSVLNALAGWGLWKLRNWGRILAIFLAVSGSTFRSLRFIMTLHPRITDFVTLGLVFAMYGLVTWYLFKSGVKAAFSPVPT